MASKKKGCGRYCGSDAARVLLLLLLRAGNQDLGAGAAAALPPARPP